MRVRLHRPVATAGVAAACVASLELALRGLAPIPLNSPRFRTSDRTCTELIPSNDGVLSTVDFRHSFQVDERGRRRGRGDAAGSAIAHSIAVVGDSMVFGEGVNDDETFVALLPGELAARGHGGWDAWNLGVGGHGTGQHVARLEDLLESGARPEVALVTFFANDPRDDRECRPFRMVGDGPELARVVPAAMTHPPPKRLPWLVSQPWYRWLTSHSQIVGRLRLRASRSDGAGSDDRKAGSSATRNALDEPMSAEELRLTQALYLRLAEDSSRHGVAVGIVLIPHAGCFGDSRVACDRKLDAVAAAARHAALPVLDLRPILAKLPWTSVYYPHDLHWTAAGHRAVAGPIADLVLELAARPRNVAPEPDSGSAGPGDTLR